jgi:hypothetical protein
VHFHKSGSVFSQWLLDSYASDAAARARFERSRQCKQRMVNAAAVVNAADPVAGNGVGKKFIPTSFTGGPTYMQRNQRHACATLARVGPPTFFITMTANPHWPELVEALRARGVDWTDAPDLVSRIFKLKKEKVRISRCHGLHASLPCAP